MVSSAPSVSTVMEKFASLIRGVPLIAHNASFDKQFLDWEFDRLGLRVEWLQGLKKMESAIKAVIMKRVACFETKERI